MEPLTVNLHKAIAEVYIGPGAGEHLSKYKAYLKHYQKSTAVPSSEKAIYQIDKPLLGSHAHIEHLVTKLRDEPSTTRLQFENVLCAGRKTLEQESQHAIRTVLRVGFMLDCTLKGSKTSRNGVRSQWQSNESFADFVARSIPKAEQGILIPYEDITASVAWNLKQRSGVRIEKTDDIADHLLYNPDTRVLKVFHQMAYLRAQLQRPQGTYALPTQLVIETLESFYRILFPIADEKIGRSKRLLRRMIRLHGFDQQCAIELEPTRWHPEDFQYLFWGNRLQIISEIAGRTAAQNRCKSATPPCFYILLIDSS